MAAGFRVVREQHQMSSNLAVVWRHTRGLGAALPAPPGSGGSERTGLARSAGTVELSSKWDSALDRLQGELRERRLHAPGSGKTEVILMLAHPKQFWLS